MSQSFRWKIRRELLMCFVFEIHQFVKEFVRSHTRAFPYLIYDSKPCKGYEQFIINFLLLDLCGAELILQNSHVYIPNARVGPLWFWSRRTLAFISIYMGSFRYRKFAICLLGILFFLSKNVCATHVKLYIRLVVSSFLFNLSKTLEFVTEQYIYILWNTSTQRNLAQPAPRKL